MSESEDQTNSQPSQAQTREFSAEGLPPINDEAFAAAVQPNNVQFIRELCSDGTVGRFHWFESMGFVLQNGGNRELRCIYLVNHPHIEHDLAFVHATIQHVGGKLVFAPYTVVVPFDETKVNTMNNENEPTPSPGADPVGMEVA